MNRMFDKRFKNVDIESLLARLTTVALGWFKGRGCFNQEAVLPNTGKSAKEIAEDALMEILTKPELWKPQSPDEDPFRLLVRIMRNRFIDIVSRRKEYERTVIIDPKLERHLAISDSDLNLGEIEMLVGELYTLVEPDLKELLEAVYLLGFREVPEIAKELGISSQEVKKRQRRMRIKLASLKLASKGATSRKG